MLVGSAKEELTGMRTENLQQWLKHTEWHEQVLISRHGEEFINFDFQAVRYESTRAQIPPSGYVAPAIEGVEFFDRC